MDDIVYPPLASSPATLDRLGPEARVVSTASPVGSSEGLPAPRGSVTDHLIDHLRRPLHGISPLPLTDGDPLTDDDLALALYLCYELHYLGLPDVDEAWEWEPSLLRERRRLEEGLERRLVDLVGLAPIGLSQQGTIEELQHLAGMDTGPSLSRYMRQDGTLAQMRELAIHRSAYQLKEADPHTWSIPRLAGRAKAALVEIQHDEYGAGRPAFVHAALFADTLDALGLVPCYGAYLDRLPGVTLSTCNLVSLFGLHRRWRAALVGHLALFELCSVGPMGRYQAALERFGLAEQATRFYQEHVTADARHEQVALQEMVAGLMEDEPFLGGEVVFGARALAAVEAMFARHLLDAWSEGRSSLLP